MARRLTDTYFISGTYTVLNLGEDGEKSQGKKFSGIFTFDEFEDIYLGLQKALRDSTINEYRYSKHMPYLADLEIKYITPL